MDLIKCAIVGLGRIASSLEDDKLREKPASHAGAIEANPDTILAGGCDPDKSKREAFNKRWSVSSVYADLPELLKETKPDILHICTNPEDHLPCLERALSREVPLIICEKPLSDNLTDARRMLELLKASKSKMLVNHERRYALDYRHVKDLTGKALYGRLLSVKASLYMGRTREVGEMLLDDGTHMIDIIRYLAGGDITGLQIKGDPAEKGGSLHLLADCDSVPIFLEVAGGRDHLVFELELSYETGRVRIGNGIYEEYRSVVSPYYEKMRSLERIDCSFPETKYFSGMMEDAVRVLRSGTEALSSCEDALKVMEFIDTVRSA